MRDATFHLFRATTLVAKLRATGANTQPVAMVLGNALGWKWPEGMNQYEAQWVASLCNLLNVNLPGRPQGIR